TLDILKIINYFRDDFYVKEIIRLIEYKIYLLEDKILKVNNSEECGIIVKSGFKKLDLSVSNYFEQLKEYIFKNSGE
ncbi:MAG: hypothetical protein ACK5XN_38575, partial [Bacteroidota bacterium]